MEGVDNDVKPVAQAAVVESKREPALGSSMREGIILIEQDRTRKERPDVPYLA